MSEALVRVKSLYHKHPRFFLGGCGLLALLSLGLLGSIVRACRWR